MKGKGSWKFYVGLKRREEISATAVLERARASLNNNTSGRSDLDFDLEKYQMSEEGKTESVRHTCIQRRQWKY